LLQLPLLLLALFFEKVNRPVRIVIPANPPLLEDGEDAADVEEQDVDDDGEVQSILLLLLLDGRSICESYADGEADGEAEEAAETEAEVDAEYDGDSWYKDENDGRLGGVSRSACSSVSGGGVLGMADDDEDSGVLLALVAAVAVVGDDAACWLAARAAVAASNRR
jgi:hypothetical protein